jgi:hypothetical protein
LIVTIRKAKEPIMSSPRRLSDWAPPRRRLLVLSLALGLTFELACQKSTEPVRDPTSDPLVEPVKPHKNKKKAKQEPKTTETDKNKLIKNTKTKTTKAKPIKDPRDPLRYLRLDKFSTSSEFDGYIEALRKDWQEYLKRQQSHRRPRRRSVAKGKVAAGPSPAAQAEAAPSADKSAADGDDQSITNNQEAGVDEGDIVKASGDFFIILRRGRLFTVRQRDYGQPTLRAVGRANAYPEGGSRGTWYDEMLIYRDRVMVIGYSYRVGGTEIGLFRLGKDGKISHEATHFLRSNDYYSSRNYASRLVGGKLIFYMPYTLRYRNQNGLTLPAVTSWHAKKRRARPWRNILSKMDVYRPLQRSSSPTLHTVVQCDMRKRRFDCRARAVIGPYSRTFYVSRDAVYVWVGAGYSYGWGGYNQARKKQVDSSPAYVYRMPILSDEVKAIRARGNPVDQFSFKQAGGHLNVLLTSQGGGDWMWAPEVKKSWRGKMALLRLPVSAFSAAPAPAASWRYTMLPKPDKGYSLQNRFVGSWVLWGAGAGWWSKPQNGGHIYAAHIKRAKSVRRISLDHGVDRIEAMGRNAVVVGSGKQDLFFTSLELTQNEATLRNTWVRKNAAQGETRSHGFFFLPGRDGGGMLGLPIRHHGRPGRHLVHGSAQVVFLSVSPELKFTLMGSLASKSRGQVKDNCVVSCVDWYGNARPIFFRGRIFALMGYELVEGTLEGGKLLETGRINYLRPRQLALFR